MNYETLRLEKGMYGESGRTFTQVLEALPDSIPLWKATGTGGHGPQ